MSELDELRKRRYELNRQIRELESGYPIVEGTAKLDRQEYPTDKPDRYFIAVRVKTINPPELNSPWGQKGYVWRSLANGATREETIKQIPEFIRDLQSLYNRLTEGTAEE